MTLSTAAARPTTQTSRIVAIDVLRGVAILTVVAYHLVWDLGSLDLIDYHIGQSTTGRMIAHSIAGTFVLLVGVSLVLAHRQRWRARRFWRREAELIAYGVLVTVVTYLAFGQEFVSFGILQLIAVSSVLALPFVWASRATALGAAGLAVVLPQLVTIPGDSRWWSWTGLTESVQPTVDSAPLLPMFALTLLGILLMRWLQDRGAVARLASWHPGRGLGSGLAFLGRHTLAIYLLHQPMLLALLHTYRAVA